jgi:putative glutathione S-transferase
MGMLIDGSWHADHEERLSRDGRFIRQDAQFRNWITPDGRPGPSGTGGFKAEPGRYHLYVSLACPWAHRTLIFRKLKALEGMISLSIVHWLMGRNGWTFEPGEGVVPDRVNAARYLYEIYAKAAPTYSGRASVPVLWDKHTQKIVSNESSEIIRMFNAAFDACGAAASDYYPEPLRVEIDEINARVYDTLNNGVYKAGFAATQAAYEEAIRPLFSTLDWLDHRLAARRFVCGERLTEADWRLFTTLVRFDPVYVGHFKCNIRRLVDYPNLWAYARDLYQMPGIRDTVDLGHIKRHYYQSHTRINPLRIVPAGPAIDFELPHNRAG